jgi:tight adherence protein B
LPTNAQWILVLAVLLGVISFFAGYRSTRVSKARNAASNAWPAFVDSVVAGLTSGVSLYEAIELALGAKPGELEGLLKDFEAALLNERMRDAVLRLKESARLAVVDEFAELVVISDQLGGRQLVSVLREHSKRVRRQNSARDNASAKTSATLAIAKLAVAAPWVLLFTLLNRAESAAAFESPVGMGILLFGLALSVGAYRLVAVIGRAEEPVRVHGATR